MMKRLFSKRKSNKGFSLSEVLVAVLILGLVTIGLATGVRAAGITYKQNVESAESNTLCSTLATAVMDELRYATDITGTSSYTFTSKTYGSGVSFSANDAGHITLGGFELIPAGAYNKLKASVTSSYSATGNCFSVTISVKSADNQDVRDISFSVTPLNQ